jgi:hypothetical protein
MTTSQYARHMNDIAGFSVPELYEQGISYRVLCMVGVCVHPSIPMLPCMSTKVPELKMLSMQMTDVNDPHSIPYNRSLQPETPSHFKTPIRPQAKNIEAPPVKKVNRYPTDYPFTPLQSPILKFSDKSFPPQNISPINSYMASKTPEWSDDDDGDYLNKLCKDMPAQQDVTKFYTTHADTHADTPDSWEEFDDLHSEESDCDSDSG